jgi:hypothetical protein
LESDIEDIVSWGFDSKSKENKAQRGAKQDCAMRLLLITFLNDL